MPPIEGLHHSTSVTGLYTGCLVILDSKTRVIRWGGEVIVPIDTVASLKEKICDIRDGRRICLFVLVCLGIVPIIGTSNVAIARLEPDWEDRLIDTTVDVVALHSEGDTSPEPHGTIVGCDADFLLETTHEARCGCAGGGIVD